jgi:Terminase small subunit
MGNRLRNTKQERFARAIAELTPLAVAYGMAGYGGVPEWHPYNASKLANKPHVKARIDELRAEFEKESAIKVEHVRHQLLRIVEADPRALYERDPDDPTGKRQRLRRIDDLPTHVALAVSNIKLDPESGSPVEIKLADKVPAAATLLRSLPGGAVERREVTLKGSDLLDPENLAKLDDDEVEALRRIASKIAGTDADSPGSTAAG